MVPHYLLMLLLIWTTMVSTQDYVADDGDENADLGPPPYPTFYSVPDTSFSCSRKWGLFADPEALCQVFHLCQGRRMNSFLCPNGTLFHQNYRICDHWYNVPCSS